MKRNITLLCLFSVLFTMCKKEPKPEQIDYSFLFGNSYTLTIDSEADLYGNYDCKSDLIEESVYYEIKDTLIQYDITFSKDGQSVSIEPGGIEGDLIKNIIEVSTYRLNKTGYVGGDFFTGINESGVLRSEHRIYGSGRPIIKSERGFLVKK